MSSLPTVTLPDGAQVPAIGQGTWYMGEQAHQRTAEVRALQEGIELGMTLIDTAEMYGEGGAERVVGEAIHGRRDRVFLVSKVYPHRAGGAKLVQACKASLKRLGTDHLDLYLVHWRGNIPLEETIEGMQKLKELGLIARWGVSNFDTVDMQELWSKEKGAECAVNQVLYHLGSRGIEFDLLPWQRERRLPTMAYCPLAQGGLLRKQLLHHRTIHELAQLYGVKPLQIVLAWSIREQDVIAIPKAVQLEHVHENAAAGSIRLAAEHTQLLDEFFPKPQRKMALDIV